MSPAGTQSTVGSLGMDRAEDVQILEFGAATGRVYIPLDHDFHAHLALSMAGKPSVVLLRVEGLAAAQQAALIVSVWDTCEDAIDSGAAVSASPRSVRIRKLPLR